MFCGRRWSSAGDDDGCGTKGRGHGNCSARCMEQMNTEGLDLVRIDYEAADTPESVKKTHPVLYVKGDGFCCLLGPDPNAGIYGCGKTVQLAMTEFDRLFQERLEHPIQGDPVSEFIQQRHV